MFQGIRWRIGIPYVILILVSMLGLGIYLSIYLWQLSLKNLETDLVKQAQLISQIIQSPLAENDLQRLSGRAIEWSHLLGTRVTIISADGVVLAESHEDELTMDNHANRPEIIQARAKGAGVSTRLSKTLEDTLMYVAVPVMENQEIVGFVRLSVPLSEIQALLSRLQQTLIGAALFITVIAILLAIWLVGLVLRPLRRLTEFVEQVSIDKLGETVNPGRALESFPDEVGQLALAFDAMTTHLDRQVGALETERTKFASVLGVMTDGLVIVDEKGIVQLINPAAEHMFNTSQANALGRSLIEVVRNHQLVEAWQSCQLSGESQYTIIEMSTHKLYLQAVLSPLGEHLPGSILLLLQDLTRLRRLETVRQDFISNVSHELRTPLASLKALTETLLEGALDEPPTARRFLTQMETEVDALSLMVSELLELSRIESGRVPIKLEPVHPCDLIEQSVERLRLQAERSGLEIQIECSDDLPMILADSSRLEQVLVNLLHNAIKFTPEQGKIRVSAVQKQDEVLFAVEDTGVGIPPADLTRIFERFYKADRARSGGGTGLGLAIARHMLDAHDGRIWVESKEGQGSTFFFTIPLAS
jgi:two-component system phosphate regulon sensor histidine kinase PhoR